MSDKHTIIENNKAFVDFCAIEYSELLNKLILLSRDDKKCL